MLHGRLNACDHLVNRARPARLGRRLPASPRTALPDRLGQSRVAEHGVQQLKEGEESRSLDLLQNMVERVGKALVEVAELIKDLQEIALGSTVDATAVGSARGHQVWVHAEAHANLPGERGRQVPVVKRLGERGQRKERRFGLEGREVDKSANNREDLAAVRRRVVEDAKVPAAKALFVLRENLLREDGQESSDHMLHFPEATAHSLFEKVNEAFIGAQLAWRDAGLEKLLEEGSAKLLVRRVNGTKALGGHASLRSSFRVRGDVILHGTRLPEPFNRPALVHLVLRGIDVGLRSLLAGADLGVAAVAK